MSALAVATGSVNLGQGFPDYPGPPEVLDVARAAIGTAADQYPPGPGHPGAAARRSPSTGSGSRGLALRPRHRGAGHRRAPPRRCRGALLALLDTGDEVVLFEPMYDCYAAGIAMAGGVVRPVPLHPPADGGGPLDVRPGRRCAPRSRRAPGCCCSTPRTTRPARSSPPRSWPLLADLAIEHDLLVLTDEVYEHLVFDGARHLSIATLPGMRERTLVVSSAGKTFNVTGWKIGWICGPAPLVAAVRTAKQFLTYVNGGPFQPAVAAGLAPARRVLRRRRPATWSTAATCWSRACARPACR